MKKLLTVFTVFALSGCYTTAQPAQDVYVEPYVAPTVYYTQPTTYTAPSVVYVEQSTPVVYVEDVAPTYVYIPNPLIYGRPHYHHHHHFSPAPRPQHHMHNAHHPHHARGGNVSHHNGAKPHRPTNAGHRKHR